jgi:hypothetical protein
LWVHRKALLGSPAVSPLSRTSRASMTGPCTIACVAPPARGA